MTIGRKLFLLLLSVTISATASANPVSFKDGWGIMPAYTPEWSELEVNYSFTNKEAVGVSNFYHEGSDSTSDFAIVRYDCLSTPTNARHGPTSGDLEIPRFGA